MTVVKSSLEIDLIDDVTANAKRVAEALARTQKTAADLQAALAKSGTTDKFQAGLKRVGASATHVEAVSKAWRDYAKAEGLAQKSSEWTKTQKDAVRSWESVTLSAIRAVKSEEATLARFREQQAERAERDAQREAAARIRAAERESLALQREARRRHEAMERNGFGHYVLGGAAAAVSAHGIFSITEEGLEAGAERQHVRIAMSNAGMKSGEITRAELAAMNAVKNAPNMSVSEIMELLKEARSAVRDPEEAFSLLPQLAKSASILRGQGVDNANLADVLKGAESLGLFNDPKRVQRYLHGQIAAMMVMGKTITTEQVYEAAKYSKATGATLSDDFLNLVMPSLIQEMHGSSVGDALSQLGRSLRGGLEHRSMAVRMLQQYHMLADPSKIVRNKHTGEITGYKGRLVGDENIASDPDKFAKILNEHFERYGAKTLADKTFALQKLPSTASNVLRILIQQALTLAAHRKLYEAVPDDDALVANQKKDPVASIGALKKGLNDLEGTVTDPMMTKAGEALSWLAAKLREVEEVAKSHPQTALAATAGGTAIAAGVSGWLSWKLLNGFTKQFAHHVAKEIGPAGETTAEVAKTAAKSGKAASGAAGFLSAGALAGIASWMMNFGESQGIAEIIKRLHLGPLKPGERSAADAYPELLHPRELYGPFRRWQVMGRGSGRWMLDNQAHYAAIKFGELSTNAETLKDKFAELSAAVGNLSATLASLGAAGETGGGGGGGGIIKASYESGGGAGPGGSGGGSAGGSGRSGGGGGGGYGGARGALADDVMEHAGGKGFNTRGVRNMNPGNIGWGSWARAHGATGWAGHDTGHGVAVFPSFDAGYAAMGALALSKYHGGARTIDQIIAGRHGWTPGNHAAAKNVARMMGISPFADANLRDPAMLEKFKRGVSVQELGPVGGKFALRHRSDPLGLRRQRAAPAHRDAAKLIEALNGGASPEIDHRSIKSYIAHLEYARSLHASMGGGGAYGRPRVAGLGAQMRGAFNHSGTDFG